MHEWALAESILIAAIDEAKKQKLKKIKEITISIGELQQIEKDIFNFALDEIIKTQDEILNQVKINITIERSLMECKHCGHKWNFDDIKKKLNEDESEAIHFLPEVAIVHSRCIKCGSPDFDIIEGRGISITSIKGTR